MSVPGIRRAELVSALDVGEEAIVLLRAPAELGSEGAEALGRQAAALSSRVGRIVLVLPAEAYDAAAIDEDVVLAAIARRRGVRFVPVAEELIPDGPPAPRSVWVERIDLLENGWEAEITLREEEG